MVKILTDAACRKFLPGPKRRRIRDAAARSLFLVIEPSGHKAWQMRVSPTGWPARPRSPRGRSTDRVTS